MGAHAISDGGSASPSGALDHDLSLFATKEGPDGHRLTLLVDGIHCGGCVAKIEKAVKGMSGVRDARVNMSTGRLVVGWTGASALAQAVGERVTGLGFRVAPLTEEDDSRDEEEAILLRSLAVAGFAAANVMLLSVSVWAGHAQGMTAATRDLLHWFSALIALPAVVYAGRPFFSSAYKALRAGGLNMDVPISLAVLLACALSIKETMAGGLHAYFDSAITLVFFLLIGRFLDRRARGKAHAAARSLLALTRRAVTVLEPDGSTHRLAASMVRHGMVLLVAPGERVGADGTVLEGRSDLDASLITGETVPQPVSPGASVHAGSVNGDGVLQITVDKAGDQTLLSQIVRLMEQAEKGRAALVGVADRAARAYAPVVHIAALATFVGWLVLGNNGWEPALRNAVAVLIITCPCALALAVPAVQVIASGALLRRGVLLKSGTALERARLIDTVVLDKTGTLTVGRPHLIAADSHDPDDLREAATMAANSRHPLARALVRGLGEDGIVPAGDVAEVPGCGLEKGRARLGNAAWCGVTEGMAGSEAELELWFTRPGKKPVRFAFADELRRDSVETVAALDKAGHDVLLLSGDRPAAVDYMARKAGIERYLGGQKPDEKVDFVRRLESGDRRVLMIGDGLNDAPALTSANLSMSPSSATDIAQTAADVVFQGDRLQPVLWVLDVAHRADRLVKQNFALSIAYNVVTIPLAVAGLVTPLIAALAMSSSSILVVLNSLRLARWSPEKGTLR